MQKCPFDSITYTLTGFSRDDQQSVLANSGSFLVSGRRFSLSLCLTVSQDNRQYGRTALAASCLTQGITLLISSVFSSIVLFHPPPSVSVGLNSLKGLPQTPCCPPTHQCLSLVLSRACLQPGNQEPHSICLSFFVYLSFFRTKSTSSHNYIHSLILSLPATALSWITNLSEDHWA